MESRPLILISNDDGYKSPGIKHLINIAQGFGEVVVVAPIRGQSGMSHAVSLNEPIRLKKRSSEPGLDIYSCSGTPADCVKIALNQVLDRKPDLVLAGINHGSNSSVSLFYSGTVAIAIEACMNRIPAIALSVDDHSVDADFSTAIHYAKPLIREALDRGLPRFTCLNVNFPKIALADCQGIKICRQTPGVWKEEFEHRVDPQNNEYYWLTGYFSNEQPEEEDTDEWALQHNYAAIVPIKVDVTDRDAMEELRKWELEEWIGG